MILHSKMSIAIVSFIECRWDCRLCEKSYQSHKQMMRHHQVAHGDIIRCNPCGYDLPRSRKYLMMRHFEQRNPGLKVCYTIHSRNKAEAQQSLLSLQTSTNCKIPISKTAKTPFKVRRKL